ncbi:hypothetical protein EZV62_022102 [Acer yangbiense]|uniref:Cytochrome P450 n=1 Tax=Acer yangbiense TaxID=1000413 RepID=A0A5C7H781_9ROSI|nr:hypothetical protein EZV62_022102 [Acer yangbiense]
MINGDLVRLLQILLGNRVGEVQRSREVRDVKPIDEDGVTEKCRLRGSDMRMRKQRDGDGEMEMEMRKQISLILGGSDTTIVTLTWAVSLLLNNHHVLKKVQDELNVHVAMATCGRGGLYHSRIPHPCRAAAGTHLVMNLWKLHRDPSVWVNPSEFIPERFIIDHPKLNVRGLLFECLPFGSGRRKYPGISLALQVMHLTLARLFHTFELGTVSDATVDMSEGPGLTVPKATPLEVVLTPRLPSMLFDSNNKEE